MVAAEQLIQDRGQQATPSRIAVLSVLMASSNAMSHPEISRQLSERGQFDRVTLYRVLDWLVHQGLAHTVASADRVRRFQATHEGLHRHAHFECVSCGKVFCLTEVHPPMPSPLPAGFSVESLDLNVKGRCVDCSSAGNSFAN